MMSPPTANVAARYKNRMLLFDVDDNPRYGYVSLPNQPEVFHQTQYDLVANAGDTIEAAVQVGDYCFIFGRNALYQFQVNSAGLIFTTVLPNISGTPNGRTVASGSNGIYYLGYDGIYLLRGFTGVKISDNVGAVFRNRDRGGLSTVYDTGMTFGNYIGGRYYFTYYGSDSIWHTLVYNESKNRWKHFTGWLYTVEPTTGAYPVVGLSSTVGIHDRSCEDDAGTSFSSSCGFNLLYHTGGGLAETVLYDIRRFRICVESDGVVTVAFYDEDTLNYSMTLTTPGFDESYIKHSLPQESCYFTQPEVRISSTRPFALRFLEVDIHPIRKHLMDYSFVTGAQVGDTSD
jgi:hypothetical protein